MLMRLKGIKRYRVRKANGRTYEYTYHRATGKRIEASVGSPEFLSEVTRLTSEAAIAQPRAGSLGALIKSYRQGPEFQGLAPRSRTDYEKVFDWLSPLDDMPLLRVDGPFMIKMRDAAFKPREQKQGETKAPPTRRRFANYVVAVMSLLFAWENHAVSLITIRQRTLRTSAVTEMRQRKIAPGPTKNLRPCCWRYLLILNS
jgi:hypothetical protein